MRKFLRIIYSILFCVIQLVILTVCQAQVINDSISNRIPLLLNEPHGSSTVKCTVEWNCLNQSLTRSCIKYHNDQWFSIRPTKAGKSYYLNLSGQECRDIWGVQVLVFSGEACQPSGYSLLACYSNGNKDDVFLTLEGLDPDREYLVNIDGYLNDQCTFAIEFSDQPRGLPVSSDDILEDSLILRDRQVEIKWTVADDIQGSMLYYEVWKNSEKDGQAIQIGKVAHQQNAFGKSLLEYTFTDTLAETMARYRVVGVGTQRRHLMADVTARVTKEDLMKAGENLIPVSLDFRKGEHIALMLYNAAADTLVYTKEFVFEPESHSRLDLYIGDLRQEGIRTYRLVIIRKEDWSRREMVFEK